MRHGRTNLLDGGNGRAENRDQRTMTRRIGVEEGAMDADGDVAEFAAFEGEQLG